MIYLGFLIQLAALIVFLASDGKAGLPLGVFGSVIAVLGLIL